MSLDALTRRAALGGGLAALALGATLSPARAQSDVPLEERGYALGDMTMGDPDAPVKIIEYASLTCGHCANFHNRTWPEIKERYVDTGKVHLTFREVYFDQFGLWTSMIARCGGEQTFFPFIDAFMKSQRDWARADDVVAEITRIGRVGGLPAERMQACLTDEAFMERLVVDYQREAGADDVSSTPTFIINGDKITGDRSVEDFAQLIEDRL
jgi:protein-disulfide isomerase